MNPLNTRFMDDLGIKVPLICGAMYPCSNPELVAAVSEAGGIGIVQPLSLSYVHGYDFREGLRYIRSLTSKPIGVNLIVEASSRKYLQRVHNWADIALEENVPLLVTALGNPDWVVEQAHQTGTLVYHDVTHRKWAEKAMNADVDGMICVNDRAGGHAGELSAQQLLNDLKNLGKPLICAGGIGSPAEFRQCLAMGYAGVQMGTRFIASQECSAHTDYKQAILDATEQDIVLSERITGVPVSVINTPYIQRIGTHAGTLATWMLKGRKTKHWMRTIYALQSIWKLKQGSHRGNPYKDIFQAGKSAGAISEIESVDHIVREFAAALHNNDN